MTHPQIGLTVASLLTMAPDVWRGAARDAHAAGMRSLWTAETVGAEAFSTLATLAPEAPGLALGTGVIALQLRTPQLAAMSAATLAVTHPDREIILGVGISSPAVVSRWHGATYGDRPLAQTRDYVSMVRQALSGEPVTAEGPFYRSNKFRLGLRQPEHRPQIVLGALNQKMLQLTGEIADGVLLNYLPATAVPWCVEQVRAGERLAGREPGSCTIYAYVHVGVTDLDTARPLAQRDLFSYAVVDAYAKAFARAGFGEEVTEIRAAHAAGDRDAAVRSVSDRMIGAIDIVGDAAHVRSSVAAYLAAGVDHAVVMPLPWGEDRKKVVADTIAAVSPLLAGNDSV